MRRVLRRTVLIDAKQGMQCLEVLGMRSDQKLVVAQQQMFLLQERQAFTYFLNHMAREIVLLLHGWNGLTQNIVFVATSQDVINMELHESLSFWALQEGRVNWTRAVLRFSSRNDENDRNQSSDPDL